MTAQKAKDYINECISLGFADPEQFKGMSDNYLAMWASEHSERADAYEEHEEE